MNTLKLLTQNPLQGTFTGPSEIFAPSGTGASAGGTPLETFLSIFLGFFTIVGGLMFLLYFVFAALAWLSAGGEKGKVESAKTQMTNAALGLVVIIMAQFIIGIVSSVLGLNILNPVIALGALWGKQ